MDLSLARRRIEDLPSDNGQAVDTLAGALLRVFDHLNRLDDAVARLSRWLAVLEGPQPTPANSPTATSEASMPAAVSKRRGRPPGSLNKSRTNGHDADEGGLDPERDLGY